jgi:mycothiol S-conjugate amidase
LRLTHWEGDETTPADCSATARMSRHGDDLFVLVTVTDDREGTRLDKDDAKRHWRTDSVEIALDPRGNGDDTSVTFKTGIFPFTDRDGDGGPAAERDADNHQGPAEKTAPGMRVAASVGEPYRGYTVEAKIPLGELPAAADPERFAANILVYDSDTQDKTGQSRLAWSPYGSAQADPYVWGTARLEGYSPPADRPTVPADPVIPTEAARSEDSPASVAQARRTGVPLAGGPLPCFPHVRPQASPAS